MSGVLLKERRRASRLSAQYIADGSPRKIASYKTLCEGIMSKKVAAPTIARQFIAYPRAGGRFAKGKDIRDAATHTTLPISDALKLADDDIYQEGIGLFIDVRTLDVRYGSQVASWQVADVVVLQATSVTVVGSGKNPLIQQSSSDWVRAIADEKTGFPLSVPGFENAWPDIPVEQKMWFYRESAQQGVKPLFVRRVVIPHDGTFVAVETIRSPRDFHSVLFEKK